jgi:hypothetical protein
MSTTPRSAPVDPDRLTFPEPPEKLRHRLTLVGAFSVLGPGAIIASANIGSGEMIFASVTRCCGPSSSPRSPRRRWPTR